MNDFLRLVAATSDHQGGAANRLQHELETQLARIVRRVLREGQGWSESTRLLFSEARRAACDAPGSPAEEHDRRIARLARRLGARVVRRLRPAAVWN